MRVDNLPARIERLLKVYDLVRYRRTKAGLLSSGEQTRLSLAKAMLNRPRLLLLDEPTASIDPSNARDIRAGIAKFVDSGHCGVLWTSHNMYEVQAVCDRVLFLSHGRIVLEGDPKTLPEEHGAASSRRSVRHRRARGAPRGRRVMNGSRVGAIVLRILYLYRGSPQRVFPIFVFVAVDIVLWGFLTRYLNSVSRADFNFVPALLGAVLLWDFLTRVMQQITMALFEDVWTRNFLNFFATPLRVSEYLAGLLIVAVTTSLLSLIAMLAFAQIGVRPLVSRLWRRAGAVPDGAVPYRDRARRHGLGPRSEAGTGLRVADLADSDADLAVRRRVLSHRGLARMDAGGGGAAAAVLRVRGHAVGGRRKPAALGSPRDRRRSGDRLPGRSPASSSSPSIAR